MSKYQIALVAVGWAQLFSAFALLLLTIQMLYDASGDVTAATDHKPYDAQRGKAAFGLRRLALLRVLDAGLLCIVGLVMVTAPYWQASIVGRLALLSITGIDLAKVLNDRRTRVEVNLAKDERTVAQDARAIAQDVRATEQDARANTLDAQEVMQDARSCAKREDHP